MSSCRGPTSKCQADTQYGIYASLTTLIAPLIGWERLEARKFGGFKAMMAVDDVQLPPNLRQMERGEYIAFLHGGGISIDGSVICASARLETGVPVDGLERDGARGIFGHNYMLQSIVTKSLVKACF